jgi:hypothetical protein
MKNWKQFTFMAIIAIVGIIMGFVACDNDNGNNDPVLCTCNPKEHYLPCTCSGTDCICKVIPRGYLTDTTRPKLNVPIYQTVGVSDEDAVTVTASIISGYGFLDDSERNSLTNASNLLKIEIVDGTEVSFDPITGIVSIGAAWPYEFADIFIDAVIPNLTTE